MSNGRRVRNELSGCPVIALPFFKDCTIDRDDRGNRCEGEDDSKERRKSDQLLERIIKGHFHATEGTNYFE